MGHLWGLKPSLGSLGNRPGASWEVMEGSWVCLGVVLRQLEDVTVASGGRLGGALKRLEPSGSVLDVLGSASVKKNLFNSFPLLCFCNFESPKPRLLLKNDGFCNNGRLFASLAFGLAFDAV